MKRLLIIFFLGFSVCAIAQTSVPTYELITVSGTNAYTATVSPAPVYPYVTGYKKVFKFTNANSGASTFNINSLGAITLRKSDGTALSSGDIPAGSVWWVVYDGTASQWRLSGGSGSAALAITPGNGTTVGADLTSVDLGGTITGDITINGDFISTIDFAYTNPVLNFKIGSNGETVITDQIHSFSLNNGGQAFFSDGAASKQGIVYSSTGYVTQLHSLTDKEYVDAKVSNTINNGVTTIAPAQDAVFDALALKAPLASPTFTGTVTIPNGGVFNTPTSLTGTNITGTASGLIAGNVTTNANLTGDVTSIGNASTLATVNSNIGSFGSATQVGTFTVNGKGLITAASNTAITGFWSLASGGTATGTNTFAMGSNPFIVTSGVTTGTGATAGHQLVFNSLISGNGVDAASTSLTSGVIIKAVSTSTAINHTPGTNSVGWFETNGANANSARTAIALSGVATNTGTTSKNIGVYASASGAATNNAIEIGAGNVSLTGTSQSITALTSTLTIGTASGNQVLFQVNAGAAGRFTSSTNFNVGTSASDLAKLYVLQPALTSANQLPAMRIDGGAHTTLTASTEQIDVHYNLARTVQFSNGATATQRAIVIQAPTYSHVSGSNTITTAATLAINNAPQTTGGFTTITNPYAFWVQAGMTYLQGGLKSEGLTLPTVGNKISIKEGSGGFMGQTALVAGTKAITVSGVTTSTRCFPSLVSANTTSLTASYQCVCTSNTVTLQANVAAGTINIADISILNYILFEPAP